jgi:hypothetical protein
MKGLRTEVIGCYTTIIYGVKNTGLNTDGALIQYAPKIFAFLSECLKPELNPVFVRT